METEEVTEFTPRAYQDELLSIAIKNNTILYLPTGSGKTYIAVMLIKELAAQVTSLEYEDGAKRTIFLVNTVNLVEQQAKYLSKFTDLKVGRYSGEARCDFWDKNEWHAELSKHQVLVMTSQILVNIIHHGYFDLERCNLLIFDECHHAVDDHPMRLIMQSFETLNNENAPRVLGLTATLLNRNVKPSSVIKEVKFLEQTYHARVATVQSLDIVLGHSTNPIEEIIHSINDERSATQDLVITMIQDLINHVLDIDFIKIDDRHKKESCVLIEAPNAMAKIKNSLVDIIEHISECGLYGGSKAILSRIVQFERFRKHAQDEAMHRTMQIIITGLTTTMKLIQDHMVCVNPLNKIFKYSSDRVIKLINLLLDYQNKILSGEAKSLCCIIFVTKRFTAKVLYHIFINLKKSHSQFHFINPEYIVGFNNNPFNDTRELVFERKQNLQVLEHFKQGQVNVLFSTNVIEEGIDVPDCTLVGMFDIPQNYRSYIQSKGRARNKDSRYVMICPKDQIAKFFPKLEQYRKVESILQTMVIQEQRAGPTQKEISDSLYQHYLEPFIIESTGAKATMTSSVALVNRYCLSLPQDMFTVLTPLWYKRTDIADFVVVLEMPIVSKLRHEIQSPFMTTLKDAKRAASLLAVRELYDAGELNDHLLPISKEKVIEDVNYLFTHWSEEDNHNVLECSSEMKPGSKNKKRRYMKKYPAVLNQCCPESTNDTVYLHIIEFIPKYAKPSETNACHTMFYELINSKQSYGLITTKPFPEICDFPLFLSSGEIQIHLISNKIIKLNSNDDLNVLKQFHAFIFGSVLKLVKPFLIFDVLNGDNSYILVPVNFVHGQYIIDYNIAKTYKTIEEVEEPTLQEKRNIIVTDDNYLGTVVYPWYRNKDTGYIVCEVTHNMNALSDFPSETYNSFCKYYEHKWNLNIENPQQPLLLVKAMSNRLNCLKPRGESKNSFKRKAQDNEDFEEHFIPELCIKMSLPPLFWLKGKCVPSILHRIHYLLLADELRRKICIETNIGRVDSKNSKWEALKIDSYLLKAKSKYSENRMDETDNFIVGGRQSPVGEDLNMKKLEFQLELTDRVKYPWKDEQEPVDIERNMETVTVFEIEYFDKFVSRKLTGDMSSYEFYKTNMSPESQQKLAITFQEPQKEINIKLLNRKKSDPGPELWQVYQSIAAVSANDVLNLERYETLGDSFLKFGSSLYLFLKFRDWNEGYLTSVKGQIVGNKNLYYCGKLKELGHIMKVTDFEPNSDWFPPKFCLPQIPQHILEKSDLSASVFYNFDIPLDEQMSGNLSEETLNNINQVLLNSINEKLKLSISMEDYLCQQIVNDKTIADAVEALIGCYLCSNGVDGAFSMLEWFKILPAIDKPSLLMYQDLPASLIKPATRQEIEFFLPNWKLLEQKINYSFKDKAFLLQALTHSSYTTNKFTHCYQRLEFIGDAILDFLITSYIFEQCDKHMTPGDITDLRSALVNNVVFASLTVRNGFHKYIKFFNPRLNDVILNFVRHQEERKFVINEEVLILLEEGDFNLAEYVDVPKVLGDVFEAIIGAVFLDTGMDLKIVWDVIYSLMKNEIIEFSRNIPKNPVRLLHESVSANPKYHDEKKTANGSIMSRLSFYIDGKKKFVYGFGDSKKQAKRAAAKIALRAINASKKIDDIY